MRLACLAQLQQQPVGRYGDHNFRFVEIAPVVRPAMFGTILSAGVLSQNPAHGRRRPLSLKRSLNLTLRHLCQSLVFSCFSCSGRACLGWFLCGVFDLC